MLSVQAKRNILGEGLINSLINNLGFEAHIPGYSFCGPGTRVVERLKRGDKPLNRLDEACKVHDIKYLNNKDLETRHNADRELLERAWERVKAKDSSFGEKAASYLVTNAMKAKLAMGASLKTKTKKGKGKGKSKTKVGKGTKKVIAAKKRNTKKKKNQLKGPRVIPLPKSGGILQYLSPILMGLSNMGTVANTANDLLKSIQKIKGSGVKRRVKLAPFKRGWGLYLRPYEAKNC